MKAWLSVLLLACLSCAPALAQAVSQISGVVRDSSGAVVPGVEVNATQTDTGTKRSVTTDAAGAYILPNLPLGPYRLEASKQGFSTYVLTGIELQVSSNPVIPITFVVGQVSEQVSVEANVGQVEQRSASVGTVVETERILDLPLNGRDPTQLITLSGAAVQGTGTAAGDMKTGVQIAVAGGLASGVQYYLDGASYMNYFSGIGGLLPFPDALQEFKLSTSTQDASSSGRSAAAVSAVTKSGTNAFHGDAFEFLRNYDMNARDYFATQRDGLKRNQFGGTFGGPIQKDKLFFFAGYQGTVVRQTPIAGQTFVPTQQMLAGDFTTITSAACQNGKAITLKAPFVNNQISPSLLSPAALKIAAHLPAPQNNCGLILYGVPFSENDAQVPIRVDYQATTKHSLFARYLLATQNSPVPYTLSGNNLLTTTGSGADDKENALALGDIWVVSATMVNSFRLAGHRLGTFSPGPNVLGPADVGINMFSYAPHFLFQTISGGFTLGSVMNGTVKHETSAGANDDLTWIHGSHQFAFGAGLTREIMRRTGVAYSYGQIQIGATTGFGLADFQLGLVSSLRQQNPNPLNYGQNFLSMYAQDTWKLTSKLTLNYGLSWEPFTGVSFVHGEVYTFSLPGFYTGQRSTVIPTAPPGFAFPGDPGFSGNSGIKKSWAAFDPRLGLAFDPFGDGKTAIRVSAGIGRDFLEGYVITNESSALPFGLTVVQSAINLDNPYVGGDPFPYNLNFKNPSYPSAAQIPCLANTCAPSFLPIPSNFQTTKQYSWSSAVQRQVTPNLFISATYIGTHLIHTIAPVELNPAIYVPNNCTAGQYGLTAPGACTQATNINQRRVLNLADPQAPPLANITQYDDGGTETYNGLLLTTRWSLAQQMKLNANYTWSHCSGIGLIGALNPGQNYLHQGYGQNVYPQNRTLDYGNCAGNREQIFNTTLLYQTPKFSNHIAHVLGSDWTLATTLVVNSGAPYTLLTSVVTDPATGFGASGATQRPNLVLLNTASPTQGQPCTSAAFCVSWLNPAAFAAPALGTAGNLAPNSFFGPMFWEWDQAVSRQFQIREGQKLEVRAEAFNITNSFRPGNPGTTLGSSTFGIITADATPPSATTAPARVLQFAMKYVF